MSVPRTWADAEPLRLAGRPRRLVPLVVGYEAVAESVSVHGGSSFRYLMEPVTAVAVVFDEGWALIDGGFDPARVRDRDQRVASFDYENYAPIVPAGDPLVDQVAEAGLDWADLAAAAITHAHFDHTGAARLLGPSQPLLMQAREWRHVNEVDDARMAFLFIDDLVRPGLSIVLLDGDTDLAPGLRAIDTSGHTPGHQSFVVELPDRTVVLAGDAADLHRNVVECVRCGSTVGEHGAERAASAIRRLAELDARPGVEVWPAHDPEWGPWREVVESRR
ncbi:MBL fold metallo-hydrolase [Microbacterium sp. 18062]|uniref:MBL fold metallo-hydrolase n=1 Tax=Microbacterium sp. 18062 TaxID=2681410 RepID=UPI001358CD8D|nr:MBL fold metallo-hydrolase [Microbacterium sp. 18062]